MFNRLTALYKIMGLKCAREDDLFKRKAIPFSTTKMHHSKILKEK